MKMLRLAAALVVALCACHAGAANLPSEVEKFLELRASCDHWRGEEGYDKERQADIDWSICQSCPGTDADLAKLKKKYRSNAKVTAALGELAPEIEPKDKAAAKRFCKSTRKPDWVH